MAAIADDVRDRYNRSCMEIACHIVAEGAITKTRSGSTYDTIFYELDPRGNAALSRAYLSQRQKQRRHSEQEWLFSLIGRRPRASYVYNLRWLGFNWWSLVQRLPRARISLKEARKSYEKEHLEFLSARWVGVRDASKTSFSSIEEVMAYSLPPMFHVGEVIESGSPQKMLMCGVRKGHIRQKGPVQKTRSRYFPRDESKSWTQLGLGPFLLLNARRRPFTSQLQRDM